MDTHNFLLNLEHGFQEEKDITNIKSYWEKDYGKIFCEVAIFMQKYAYTIIDFKEVNISKRIELFPNKTQISLENIPIYENYIQTDLLPIGYIYIENVSLFIGKNNNLYGLDEGFITCFGNNFSFLIKKIAYNEFDYFIWNEIEELM